MVDIPKETLEDLKGLINVMTELSRQIEEKNHKDYTSEVRDYKRLVDPHPSFTDITVRKPSCDSYKMYTASLHT